MKAGASWLSWSEDILSEIDKMICRCEKKNGIRNQLGLKRIDIEAFSELLGRCCADKVSNSDKGSKTLFQDIVDSCKDFVCPMTQELI